MFKKDIKEIKIEDDVESIIGPSVKVEGNFFSRGNIIIGGIIKGKISTAGNLRVNENAVINADIEAENAVIAGEIVGNIKIKKNLQILASAKITGDIFTGALSIEEGAQLNGKCSMATNKNISSQTEEIKVKHFEEKAQQNL